MNNARFTILTLAAVAVATMGVGCHSAMEEGASQPLAVDVAPPAAANDASSGFFQSDGLRLHYESFGTGRPLILVHGWGSNTKQGWVDTGWVDALKSTRRVISFDCRGHGQSDKPHDQAAYSYATMSRDVLALMDSLGIEKADFLGYSMGAFMGASLLGHHADRFTTIMMGGIGNETEESKNERFVIAEALRAPDLSSITDPVGYGYRLFVDADPTSDREALAVAALQMWPEGYPLELGGAGLAQVSIPVLMVDGGEDHPYIDSVSLFANAVPGARVVTIAGTDHLSTVIDAGFQKAVGDFLASH